MGKEIEHGDLGTLLVADILNGKKKKAIGGKPPELADDGPQISTPTLRRPRPMPERCPFDIETL